MYRKYLESYICYSNDFFRLLESRLYLMSFCFHNINNVQQQIMNIVKRWSNRSLFIVASWASWTFPHPFRPESFFLQFNHLSCTAHHHGTWSQSIVPTRLSTHIFDCSANMPKFIPQPSSSPSDYYDAGNVTTTLIHVSIELLRYRQS